MTPVKGNSKPALRKARRSSGPVLAPDVIPFRNIPGRQGGMLLVRSKEARRMLGSISKDRLAQLVWDKRLPIVKFGPHGVWYFAVTDIERLIAESRAYFDGSPCED